MTPNLYGYWRSSASWRVRWAFELKKIPYNYIPVNILKGEHREAIHLERNPMGALPVLEVSQGSFISQSMAMLMWIEENYASTPMIFGMDRTHRYKILELCELINADTAPLQTPRVQNVHSSDPGKKLEWAKHFTHQGLLAFEKNVEKISGAYCVGNELSAADLFLVPQMYNARRFELPFEEYPTLKKIWEKCMATAECHKSAPEQQIDALK